MIQTSIFQPLIDHPSQKPFLTVEADGLRIEALHARVDRLVAVLEHGDPVIALARSWHAVAHGAELFDEDLLGTLEQTAPLIRQHYPEARRALAMNLAAQGCHVWFLRSHEEAVAPLSEALDLMLRFPIALEADVLKVGEVLADCLRDCERYDDALKVLYSVQHLFLAAIEQDEWTPFQYDEFREQFIDEHARDCADELKHLVAALEGSRIARPREAADQCPVAAPHSYTSTSLNGGNRG